MFPAGQVPAARVVRKLTIRGYNAWLLCALLLVFSGNARQARYTSERNSLRLATAQSYLDDTTGLEVTFAGLLLLWGVAAVSSPRLTAIYLPLTVAAVPRTARRGEFDPESHLRPPPAS